MPNLFSFRSWGLSKEFPGIECQVCQPNRELLLESLIIIRSGILSGTCLCVYGGIVSESKISGHIQADSIYF